MQIIQTFTKIEVYKLMEPELNQQKIVAQKVLGRGKLPQMSLCLSVFGRGNDSV